ncbi:hypothetical protein FHS61_000796 [Altererythrobacter atlanticus]|uniref:Uncharacterized protein n=1 Tax=Croceibacterium atlanticum TaxID=1267766 RepID=A0A0F7KXH4_9SPHN|nr:hypothetical protein [Croceibacterium atlanticum]AKH43500.1 hypothetical protein WYH_02470 [Croceibacterium atlanticum]MBB5731792.1 hypothetical protein [Croceibacterium atlanticum]
MIDKPEKNKNSQAPELYNDEQEDESSQSQEIAEEARKRMPDEDRATESTKKRGSGIMGEDSQDLVDHMKDMEQSGRIDMAAYRGEDNLDDNEDKYDRSNRVDDLPSDGS